MKVDQEDRFCFLPTCGVCRSKGLIIASAMVLCEAKEVDGIVAVDILPGDVLPMTTCRRKHYTSVHLSRLVPSPSWQTIVACRHRKLEAKPKRERFVLYAPRPRPVLKCIPPTAPIVSQHVPCFVSTSFTFILSLSWQIIAFQSETRAPKRTSFCSAPGLFLRPGACGPPFPFRKIERYVMLSMPPDASEPRVRP
jgi:hypothetical protein